MPQILINRTPNYQMAFDVQLLGNCDTIVAELCRMAGWELKHEKLPGGTSNVPNMELNTNADGAGEGGRAAWSFMEPNTYLFEGALLEELDFEAVKERSRNRHAEQGKESDDEQEDDEDQEDENAAPSDTEDIDGSVPESSTRHTLQGKSTAGEEDEDEDGPDDVSALPHIDSAASLAKVRLTVVGIASGTTSPRSGSITDIHQSGHSDSILDSSLSDTSTKRVVCDTELLKKMHFTESMPRDIDEDLVRDKTGDGLGQQLDPAHTLRHSRRPSADLGPISEDALLEVDDIEEGDEEVKSPVSKTAGAISSGTKPLA